MQATWSKLSPERFPQSVESPGGMPSRIVDAANHVRASEFAKTRQVSVRHEFDTR